MLHTSADKSFDELYLENRQNSVKTSLVLGFPEILTIIINVPEWVTTHGFMWEEKENNIHVNNQFAFKTWNKITISQ